MIGLLCFNILAIITFGGCDIGIDRCVYTLKYQMSGEEFVRDFYSGDRILKITDDYLYWTIKKFWDEDAAEMSSIDLSYYKNGSQQTGTLKEMKSMNENLTFSQEIGITDEILLDTIPTPITILSCRDLYHAFQNSVVYTLHYSNQQIYIDVSLDGPVYLMVISGQLYMTLETSKGKNCRNIFTAGDLVYIPVGFLIVKSDTRGRFLAIEMTWKPNPNKSKIICKSSTLQSLNTDDRGSINGSNFQYRETKSLRLNTGDLIPPVGLTIRQKSKIVKVALKLGYKLFHILKTNESHGIKLSIEEELKIGMEKMGIRRKDIFISVRINLELISNKGTVENIIEETLNRLNMTYIDLAILELPYQANSMSERTPELQKVWKHFSTIKASGKIRALGLCNVKSIQELEAIHAYETDGLSVVENWFDLQRPDEDVRRRCKELSIVYMAYGLLGSVRMKLEKVRIVIGLSHVTPRWA